jgi:RimJ/RimL family protein N-acetyltransferase
MSLSIVPLDSKFFEFVRNLRNDPRVREGFISQGEVTPDDHAAYMKLNHANYFVCLRGSKPVGYFGVINDDIRIATSPEEMQTGVASYMVSYISEHFPHAVAKVKIKNSASQKLFEKSGYKPSFIIYTKPVVE